MRIYWYWPHAHRETSALCRAVLRPGDSLTVQALPARPGEAVEPIADYEVVRDLPDPLAGGRAVRALRPLRLTVGRARARARLARRGFDVAHIGNLVYQTDWADLARLRRRVPLVCDVHDVRPHRRTLPAPLETALLARTYRDASDLIVLHDVLRDELLADFRVDPDRVHVVPHVLDAGASRDPSVPAPARPVLLLFGTLRANKGLDVLADAVLALGPRLDADVVIAGAGDAATVRALHERLGGAPNVRLETERIPPARKRALFSGASWVLLPYRAFHSQSGVLADAYAYRVPVVVSDVGAIGPTVRADATGLVVPPGDAGALAGALLEAAATPAGRYAAALDAAALRHDVSVVGPRLREIYAIAAARRAGA